MSHRQKQKRNEIFHQDNKNVEILNWLDYRKRLIQPSRLTTAVSNHPERVEF